jgi:hypothetical protein
VPAHFYVPDPIASPVSKSLEAACPVQDTHGAGVVMPAYGHTVVVKKNPSALYTPSNKIFLGKVLFYFILKIIEKLVNIKVSVFKGHITRRMWHNQKIIHIPQFAIRNLHLSKPSNP